MKGQCFIITRIHSENLTEMYLSYLTNLVTKAKALRQNCEDYLLH